MIAVLTDDRAQAVKVLMARGDIKSFKMNQGTGVFHSDLPFKVVSTFEQLNGLELTDYIVVGQPVDELVEKARARIR